MTMGREDEVGEEWSKSRKMKTHQTAVYAVRVFGEQRVEPASKAYTIIIIMYL